MRTEWKPEDQIVLIKAKTAAEDRLVLEYADTYRILAHLYDIVRTPQVSPDGEIVKDRHGLPFTHARLSDAPPQPGRAP
jgi:hypothetical protein